MRTASLQCGSLRIEIESSMAVEHLPRLSSVASLVCLLNDDASAAADGVEKAVFVSGWIREEDTVSLLTHAHSAPFFALSHINSFF